MELSDIQQQGGFTFSVSSLNAFNVTSHGKQAESPLATDLFLLLTFVRTAQVMTATL